MNTHLNRRLFLKHAVLTAGALSTVHFNILHAATAGDKLKCVVIGCGGRGMSHVSAALGQSLVAIVDANEKRHAAVRKAMTDKKQDGDKLQVFTDYRKMFEKIGKNIDAVFIATPNHHHAPPALLAMQLGKGVYCEKPVCHDIAEARRLREVAKQNKATTQMGNQGHCEDGYRKLCEYIWGGVIGKVTESHSWTDRANGGSGPRPATEPAPEGMHWEEWIGPAPYRDYHKDLHPHEWHGWYDFGNGSIGNMGCHILDGVFWSLKIEHPTSIEVEEMRGGSDERYPTGSRVRWDIPARGDMPALKAYWYEGLKKDATGAAEGNLKTAKGKSRNLPPLMAELQAKYPDEEFDSNGTLYVGEKGDIYTGCYGERMHVVPMETMKQIQAPPKTLPRPKNIFTDFIEACRAGRTDTAASFEYGTRLTEFSLTANLAQHVGPGKKVEWDGPNMKVTNIPELNAWVGREYRQGWRA
ncbi:MAG: Gfo/Idh/MocA family oxidoreductase [Verrucomicrobia bacterium]|nr:Gfo/Idh/MocA family oxidoreductase [Verrucomicrobiota bacterium]